MRITFERKPSGLILANFYCPTRTRISTKLIVDAADWNAETYRVRKSHRHAKELNTRLTFIEHQIIRVVLDAERAAESRHEIVSEIRRRLFPREATSQPMANMDEAFRQFLEYHRNQGTTKRRMDHHRSTFRKFRRALGRIEFHELNQESQDEFVAYLRDIGNAHNTIASNLRTMKGFFNFASQRQFPVPSEITDQKSWRMSERVPDNPTLTDRELELLKQPIAHARLDRVRWQLVWLCLTAMRYGDFIKLTDDNIVEHEDQIILSYASEKTGISVVAPLHLFACELLQQHRQEGGRLFDTMSNQKFNSYLKELFAKLGLTRNHNGIPLNEQVTSHIGRRTFITLWFENGGTIEGCRIHSGHQDLEILLRYHKKSLTHNARVGRHVIK